MKGHIAALDGFRGLAALSVVALHMTMETAFGGFPARGHLAVDFFFILSGFVVCSAYEKRLAGGMKFGEFIRVRMVRLYPLIFLGTILGLASRILALHAHGLQPNAPQSYKEIFLAFGLGLAMLPYIGGSAGIFPLDDPVWSLMFELIANIFYVAIRPLGLTLIGLVVAVCAIGLVPTGYFQNGLGGGFSDTTMFVGLQRVGFSFFAGVLIFHAASNGWLDRLPRVPFWILGSVLVASFFVPDWKYGWAYEVAAVLLLYPALLATGSRCILSLKAARAAVFAGRISYPIYILHYPIFVHLSHFRSINLFVVAVFIVCSLFAISVIGWAASKFYDEPIRRWLNKFTVAPLILELPQIAE